MDYDNKLTNSIRCTLQIQSVIFDYDKYSKQFINEKINLNIGVLMPSSNSPPRLHLHNTSKKKRQCTSRSSKNNRYYSPDYANHGLSSPWRAQHTENLNYNMMGGRKVYPRGYFQQLPLPNDYLDYEPTHYNTGFELPSPQQFSSYNWKAAQTDRINIQRQPFSVYDSKGYKQPYTNQTQRYKYSQYNESNRNNNQMRNEQRHNYDNRQDYNNYQQHNSRNQYYEYQDRHYFDLQNKRRGNRFQQQNQLQNYKWNENDNYNNYNSNEINNSNNNNNNGMHNKNNTNSNNRVNNNNTNNRHEVVPQINSNRLKPQPLPSTPIILQQSQPSHQFSSSHSTFIHRADHNSQLSNISHKQQQQQQGNKKTFSQAILDQLMRDTEHKKYQEKYNSDHKYQQVIIGKIQKTVHNTHNNQLIIKQQQQRKKKQQLIIQQNKQKLQHNKQNSNHIQNNYNRKKPKLQITTLPSITQQPQIQQVAPLSPTLVRPSKHLSTQPTLSLAVSRSSQNFANISSTSPTNMQNNKGYNLRSSTAQTVDQSILHRHQANTQTQDNSQSQLIIFQKLVQNVMDDRDFRTRINNKMDQFSQIKVQFDQIQPVQLNGLIQTKQKYVRQSEQFLSRMNRIIGDADIQRRTRQVSFDARSRAQSNSSNVSVSMQRHLPHPVLVKQVVPQGQTMTHVRSQPSFSFPNSQQSISTIKPQTAQYIAGPPNAIPQIQVHSPPSYPPRLTAPQIQQNSNPLILNPYQNVIMTALPRPVQFGNQFGLLAPPSPMQVAQQVSYQRTSTVRDRSNAHN